MNTTYNITAALGSGEDGKKRMESLELFIKEKELNNASQAIRLLIDSIEHDKMIL